MKGPMLWLSFAAIAVAQLAAPTAMIHKRTTTLEQGTQYKFRTGAIDPADPFLGRYVALNLEAARISLSKPTQGDAYVGGQPGYAAIIIGDDGYARLGLPLTKPPATGDHLKTRVLWKTAEELFLHLPFDRYYMEESLAPEAEQAYFRAMTARRVAEESGVPATEQQEIFITVRMHKGFGVLEELYIDNVPIREHLAAEASRAGPAASAP